MYWTLSLAKYVSRAQRSYFAKAGQPAKLSYQRKKVLKDLTKKCKNEQFWVFRVFKPFDPKMSSNCNLT